jgi:phenylalanyl-tRNA synthetase beta subunit
LDLPKLSSASFKPIATTPIVERDLTVDSSTEVSSAEIAKIIRSEAGAELTSLRLISRFQKDKNSPIALSYRLKWQSATETLSGEAIDAKVSQIRSLLESKLGVTFRI